MNCSVNIGKKDLTMSGYETHNINCPDRDCKTVFEIQAKQTDIQQSNFIQCPTCKEEFRFPKSGNWSIDNKSSVAVGKW